MILTHYIESVQMTDSSHHPEAESPIKKISTEPKEESPATLQQAKNKAKE